MAAIAIEMSPGCSPASGPGLTPFGLIFTQGGICGSDHTTFPRLRRTQRLTLTMPAYLPTTSLLTLAGRSASSSSGGWMSWRVTAR
jgi:hypothetical protein